MSIAFRRWHVVPHDFCRQPLPTAPCFRCWTEKGAERLARHYNRLAAIARHDVYWIAMRREI